MRTRGASLLPGGAPVALHQRDIVTRIGEPPLHVYRSTYFLDLTTGDAAEGVRIDLGEEATRLVGTFEHLEYDALEVEGASTSRAGSGLVVDLGAIRQIVRLVFDPARVAVPDYQLRLYRTVGSNPVGEPFHTASNGVRYGTRYDGPAPARRLVEGGGASIGSDFDRLPPHLEDRFILQVTPSFAVDQRERRFYLQMIRPDGTTQPLNPADLLEIRVRGAPTNPRVGLAFPGPGGDSDPPPEEAVFFWRGRGETGPSASLTDVTLHPDSAFGAELQRLLDRYATQHGDRRHAWAALPSPLRAALVFESDAPCRLRIDDLEIAYALRRRLLPDGEDKKVVRFVAGQRDTEDVRYALPAGARVEAGALRVEATFSADRDVAGPPPSEGLSRRGGHLVGDQVVAQPLELSDATRISGVSLALLPIAPAAELVLELREDRDGAPGRVLRDAPLRTSTTAHRWYDVRFAEPILLPTSPHWLLLRATSGSAIWVVAADEGETAPHILRPANIPGSWQTATRLSGCQALHRLRARSGPGADAAPVEIRIGETVLDLAPAPGGSMLSSDIRSAVHLPSDTGTRADTNDLTVSVSATGPGRLTLYPIDLIYHLE